MEDAQKMELSNELDRQIYKWADNLYFRAVKNPFDTWRGGSPNSTSITIGCETLQGCGGSDLGQNIITCFMHSPQSVKNILNVKGTGNTKNSTVKWREQYKTIFYRKIA